jgi:hypothetical protein
MKSSIIAAMFVAMAAIATAQPAAAESSELLENLPADFRGSGSAARYVSYVEVASHPAIAKAMATATRNYYDALVAAGFSKDEALRIVVSAPSPLPMMAED